MAGKLNVGCGRNILKDWINLDCISMPGIDIVADIDQCKDKPLPFDDNSIDEFLLSHVIEHLHNPLPLMQELYRIATPDAVALIKVPHGSSDDAFEDPTHIRQYFHGSFYYFSQPFYWKADYGYRGDWQAKKIQLLVPASDNQGLTADDIFTKVKTLRNQVTEMVVELHAVKPAREPLGELHQPAKFEFILT